MATEEELKRAFKAFKKRLKLARLDDASGLGIGSKTSKIGESRLRRDIHPGSGTSS